MVTVDLSWAVKELTKHFIDFLQWKKRIKYMSINILKKTHVNDTKMRYLSFL